MCSQGLIRQAAVTGAHLAIMSCQNPVSNKRCILGNQLNVSDLVLYSVLVLLAMPIGARLTVLIQILI